MKNKKKIDIAMSFNDITPPQEICFVPKPISYYDQLVCLVKSINQNWDTSIYDYQIYIHHSRELEESKKEFLKSLGCEVIFNEYETQLYFNRFECYNYNTDGDYTFILDTDMLLLKTPILDFSKEVYVKETSAQPINMGTWGEYYSRCGLGNFQPTTPHHFNGGCVLIKNSKKKEIYNLLHTDLYQTVLRELEQGPGRSRHYSPQIILSLLLKNLDLGYFKPDVNVFSSRPFNLNEVSLLHYLGVHGYTSTVANLIGKYKA